MQISCLEDIILGKRFKLTALLGKGSQGSVFSAQDLSTRKIVAVKLFEQLSIMELEVCIF